MNTNINRLVGQQIRKYRRLAGMTQVQLAVRCGIYQTYLSRIENGAANPSVFLLNAIATALGVDLATLLNK
ncbi:MAG: helix-turn-helix transcriptional regulator [Rhodoferax sp.]|nr:helix-turn-helix transcriptional regulator [Rhodoferax sp.]